MKQAILPVVPLLWAVLWAARAANKKSGKPSSSGTTALSHPANVALSGQALIRGLGCLLLPILWALAFTAAAGDPNLDLLPQLGLAVGFTALCLPQWVPAACRVLPVSLSFNLARSVGFNWARSHNVAGAVIITAQSRRLTEQEADWLMDRLRNSPHCYALTWVAAGAVRANRDDLRVARLLYGIAGRIPPMVGAEPARRMAREWLIADAVQRGAWTEAKDWATRGRGLHAYVTGLGKVVDAFATGEGVGAATAAMFMHMRFKLAATVKRFVRADASMEGGSGSAERPQSSAPGNWQEALGRALALHARAREGRRVEDVQAACVAWDQVADNPELKAWVRSRADVLRPAGAPLDRLLGRSVTELGEVMWRERWFVPGTGTFGRVSDAAMDRAWFELKDRAYAVYKLAETPDRVLYSHDAFLTLEPLRVLAEAMMRDRPQDRGTVFQAMYSGSLHLAVVLYNKRGFKYFGHMVFHWLRNEGDGVMTETLRGVLDGNIGSGV